MPRVMPAAMVSASDPMSGATRHSVSGVWVPRAPRNCAGPPSRPDCRAEVKNRVNADSAVAPLSAVLSDAALQDSLPRCLANCRQEIDEDDLN
jgi:hypothetical protein